MDKLAICNSALARIGEPRIPSLDTGVTRADECNYYYTEARKLMLAEHWWNFAAEKVILEPTWVSMTSVADSSGEVVVTKSSHGLVTGDKIRAKDTTQSDGPFFITRVNGDSFVLDDSTYSSAVTAGSFTKIPKFDGNYLVALPSDCIHVRAVGGYDIGASEQVWRVVGRELHMECEKSFVIYTKDVEDESLFPPNFSECLALKLAYFLAGVCGDDAAKKQTALAELENNAIAKALRNNAIEKRRRSSDYNSQLFTATDARKFGFPY